VFSSASASSAWSPREPDGRISRIASRYSIVCLGTAFLLAAACGSNSTPSGPTGPTTNAPQIACPADLTVTGVTAASQAVSYAAPTVTDGAAPVSTTCSPVSGASFPLGTTTVSCAASDAQARQASCSFKVTLKGMSIPIRKIDAFGDSFTEGENALPSTTFVDTPNAYPTKLQATLDAVYPGQGIKVINHGQNGQPAERTVDVIRTSVAADRPDVVLVLTGYNNMLGGGCRVSDGQNPACASAINDIAVAIFDCIRKARESSSTVSYVFVSTLTPSGPLVLPTTDRRLRSDAITQVNARIRQVVAAQRAILVDTYPTFLGHEAEYVSIDGLHLRPAGYQALADAFFAAIQATIPQTPLFGFMFPS
jgi:lysophospholipase L1-like esterase